MESPRPVSDESHPDSPPMVTLAGMAQTVTVHDPATDSTFQATRTQWERLHQPAGRTLIADENGNPPKIASKRTTPDPAAEQE